MDNCFTFTPQYSKEPSTKELVFIDVSAETKQPTLVKEERPTTPTDNRNITVSTSKPAKERLQCSECSRVCYSAEGMVRHLRMHRGENPFQCVMCNYTAYNKTLFEEHVNTHMGIKPYKCSHCEYRSVSKKYIKKHEASHGICDACGHVARNERRLRRHREQFGCGGPPPLDKGEYSCANCNVFYSTFEDLRIHKKSHKKCTHCDKVFTTQLLMRHLEEEHNIKRPDKCTKYKFKCIHCKFKSNLLNKVLLHLIHHPQKVDEDAIDITPLVNTGILTRESNDK